MDACLLCGGLGFCGSPTILLMKPRFLQNRYRTVLVNREENGELVGRPEADGGEVVSDAAGQVDRRRLAKAPLALVAFQINFSDLDRRAFSKDVMRFRNALNDSDYGEMTQVRKSQLTLQVSALGAAPASEVSASSGWRFARRDQSWSLTLFQESMILEAHAQAYGDWSTSFRPRLEAAVCALGTVFQPELETRVGLRYINSLSVVEATKPNFWKGRIQQAFLGPLGDTRLAEHFRTSALRVTFELNQSQANVNIAFQPDVVHIGNTAVVFDTDVYRQDTKEFSHERILSEADQLNTQALWLFQCIVSAAQLDELR